MEILSNAQIRYNFQISNPLMKKKEGKSYFIRNVLLSRFYSWLLVMNSMVPLLPLVVRGVSVAPQTTPSHPCTPSHTNLRFLQGSFYSFECEFPRLSPSTWPTVFVNSSDTWCSPWPHQIWDSSVGFLTTSPKGMTQSAEADKEECSLRLYLPFSSFSLFAGRCR